MEKKKTDDYKKKARECNQVRNSDVRHVCVNRGHYEVTELHFEAHEHLLSDCFHALALTARFVFLHFGPRSTAVAEAIAKEAQPHTKSLQAWRKKLTDALEAASVPRLKHGVAYSS